MMDYWVAFARNGAPAAPDAPAWQAYSEQQAYMRFAKSATPARNLLPGMFEMQEEVVRRRRAANRSDEHTSELQSLMRISYAVFSLKNKTIQSITFKLAADNQPSKHLQK